MTVVGGPSLKEKPPLIRFIKTRMAKKGNTKKVSCFNFWIHSSTAAPGHGIFPKTGGGVRITYIVHQGRMGAYYTWLW